MKMKTLIIAGLVSLLLGCSAPPEKYVAPYTLTIDSTLLDPCPLVPSSNIVTIDDALLENIELYSLYSVCARKQESSIKALKEIGGIK
jgi:hypothetical protein